MFKRSLSDTIFSSELLNFADNVDRNENLSGAARKIWNFAPHKKNSWVFVGSVSGWKIVWFTMGKMLVPWPMMRSNKGCVWVAPGLEASRQRFNWRIFIWLLMFHLGSKKSWNKYSTGCLNDGGRRENNYWLSLKRLRIYFILSSWKYVTSTHLLSLLSVCHCCYARAEKPLFSLWGGKLQFLKLPFYSM